MKYHRTVTISHEMTMKFILIHFYLFVIFLAFSEARLKSYGAKNARNGQFPFVVLISYKGHKHCGGSIIHERWILTAAHCLHENTSKPLITVGTSGNLGSGTTYRAKKLFFHPDFIVIPEDENDGLEFVDNDIGLILLASNITFTYKIQPVSLATLDDGSYENSIATIPGWGSAEYYEDMSKHLRYINVRVLTKKECQKVWTYADKHYCTSTQEQQGVCYGDSGSPMLVGNVQVGIACTADTFCESVKPDLFTKVASFITWIESIMSYYGDVLSEFN
ncbi:chymotrypsin-1-like [Phymastichus coffea]|uniref:chymotrypsin-1-like n=1 Tax=Phymastichus coffea TaxID=108790 RepID=UPI00273C1FAD|nr:chymotrypsin-1-like [Phymastichus coffea]XP_058797614.1 chymotrypsin-1-like [Phymastichus coffea]XP_058797615.1 chymotrypsin-1-like [Phymastichus coffea]XP_058797616.1 chymotrypsin-1-like [Phymastichus coffea]XP_058797617.1 chymotrypsin-1-like [Phymastichus coffea]XP_058797618.1 chymotrypsin-1-like [Phymastichus coffea]